MTQYLIPKLHSILDILSIFHDWIRAVYVQIFWLCTWSLRHPWKTRVPSFGKISPCCCNCESYCWIFLIEINFLIGLWNISFLIWIHLIFFLFQSSLHIFNTLRILRNSCDRIKNFCMMRKNFCMLKKSYTLLTNPTSNKWKSVNGKNHL